MAVTDKALIFSKAQAITSDAMSENVVDLKVVRDIARGQPIYLNIYVDTAFSVDTETIDIAIANSSATPAKTDAKVTYGPYATTASVLGKKGLLLRTALPQRILTQRYVSISYVATTAVAGGKISTYLTIGEDSD